MTTVRTLLRHTPRRAGLTLAALALAAASASAFPILTNVVETGGDNEPTDTITAKWTGVTWLTTIANEPVPSTPVGTPFTVPPFGEDVPAYVDRAHEWNGATTTLPIPGYLLGGEYIMVGNDNRDNNPFQLDLYVSEPCVVFMLVDWRNGDVAQGGSTANTDPPFLGAPLDQWAAMTWLGAGGFQPLMTGYNRHGRVDWPDQVGVDEVGTRGIGPGVEIQQYSAIYYKLVNPAPSGTPAISLYEPAAAGQNMYGVVVTPLSPAVPGNLQAASMNGRVILTWNASAGATNYIVRRSGTSGGPYSDLASSPTPGFTDSSVVNGQTYYYVVAAQGLFGTSGNSAQAIGTPKLAPESFTATGGTNQITLSWTAMAGADTYTVKRADVSGGPYTPIASGIAATSYTDAGLTAGRRYYYTVSAALTGGGESANADEASALTAPSVPGNVVASLFAASVIRVGWANADPTTPSVQIERSTDGVNFTLLAANTTGSPYYHTSLPALTTNYYRLRATNTGGFSPYSAVVSAGTPSWGFNVNFANNTNGNTATLAPTPVGYVQDIGYMYGDQGVGRNYGWDADNTPNSRYRQAANSPDLRYDTFNHLQKQSPSRVWEIDLANGLYIAHIVAGDASAVDSVFQFDVEGMITTTYTPAANAWWGEFNATFKVSDGRLTINSGPLARNNKICFVDIYPTTPMTNTLTYQPVSQTVTQNTSVTFSVGVGGGPEPVGYQWYGPGGMIWGANDPTYTIFPVQLADAGNYYVVVTNAGASVRSTNALLTVIPDTWAPTALSAGSVDGGSIGICFSEPLDLTAAYNAANFLVNNQAGLVWYTQLREGDRTVQLFLSTPITADFTVKILNMKDLAGNEMPETTLNGIYMGLTPADIGGPAFGGESFTCDGVNLTIIGGGTDIWDANDQFHYAYKTATGDFDARARLASLTQANVWTKGGLMARENAFGDSRNVMICATPLPLNNLYQTQWRDVAAAASGNAGTANGVSYPDAWMRLLRQGNTFTTLIKTNGLDWVTTHAYTPSAAYPAEVLLGLAVTAHDNSRTATGQFSAFTVTAPKNDVSLSKTAGTATVVPGGAITYTITARNQGALAPAVVVTDPLPAGVTYVSSAASVGSAVHSAGTVTWTVGDLTSGASATLAITVTANTAGSKVNTATAASGGTDEDLANNSASATVQVVAPPTLTGPTYSDGKFQFSLATLNGVTYRVEYTDSLTAVDWTTLATIVGDGTVKVITDLTPAPDHRFYRTVIVTSP